MAFILFPLLLTTKYWGNIASGQYTYYDARYETLSEYIFILIRGLGFPFLPLLFLITILAPFQIIKDICQKRKVQLPYWKKHIIFAAIMCVWVIALGPYLLKPNWLVIGRYTILIAGLSFVFPYLLGLLVDRYAEKRD